MQVNRDAVNGNTVKWRFDGNNNEIMLIVSNIITP